MGNNNAVDRQRELHWHAAASVPGVALHKAVPMRSSAVSMGHVSIIGNVVSCSDSEYKGGNHNGAKPKYSQNDQHYFHLLSLPNGALFAVIYNNYARTEPNFMLLVYTGG